MIQDIFISCLFSFEVITKVFLADIKNSFTRHRIPADNISQASSIINVYTRHYLQFFQPYITSQDKKLMLKSLQSNQEGNNFNHEMYICQ